MAPPAFLPSSLSEDVSNMTGISISAAYSPSVDVVNDGRSRPGDPRMSNLLLPRDWKTWNSEQLTDFIINAVHDGSLGKYRERIKDKVIKNGFKGADLENFSN